MLAELLAERWGGHWQSERKFFSVLAEVTVGSRRGWLCKPQTYMNNSGDAVGAVVRFHKVPPEGMLVVVDDADLPLGSIRLKPSGGSGGHHGLESINQALGDGRYPRLRLGIARPQQRGRDIAGHVLGRFAQDERQVWQGVLERASELAECWLREGIVTAMNRYNGLVA
jgi:PTH1 family peptidyl-tRNA hydrolase